jgi:ClpP class serine protease
VKGTLYAADPAWLKDYLETRINARAEDIIAARELFTSVPSPGTPQAVDEIYSLSAGAAHIRIEGPMSPEGPDAWDRIMSYGGTSYKTIIAAIDRAEHDPAALSIFFDINSPGGYLEGVDAAWAAHRGAFKKTTAVISGIAASAAYWFAAPADKILASSPTDLAGSIGIIATAIDASGLMEKMGVKKVEFISKSAPLKTGDIQGKAFREGIQARLDAQERIFYARVSEGRGVTSDHIAEHFGKGGLLVASDPSPEHEDAIRAGMIDGLVEGHFRSATHRPLSAQEQKEIAASLEESMKPGAKFYSSDGKELSPAECEKTRQEIIEMVNLADTEYTAKTSAKIINALSSPLSGAKNTPAQAGTKQEGQTMNLSELLAANPAAAAEVEALKAAARAEGREEALAEQSAQISRVMGVITSEAYPANIKALAGDVLARKKGIDAFDAAVAVYDSELERRKSEAAQAETTATGALAADKPDGKSADELAMESAGNAAIEKAKARNEEAAKWA